MSGTGACDVTGVIPYPAEPQAYDPPSHVLATANQRPVTAAYPYYIGTTADFFDPGYRAATIYAALRNRPAPLTPARFAAVQTSLTDQLAARMVPELLTALRGTALSSAERSAVSLLSTWPATMRAGSPAASVWWTFWGDYLSAVFQPWWNQAKVPIGQGPRRPRGLGRSGQPGRGPRGVDARRPGQPGVRPPVGGAADRAAGHAAGLRHGRGAPVVRARRRAAGVDLGAAARARVPFAQRDERPGVRAAGGGGDPFTPDAADGGLTATTGPSWRMIVTLSPAGVSAEGVYPGGQSENPASPWYEDQVPLWWDGRYLTRVPAHSRAPGWRRIADLDADRGGRPWLTRGGSASAAPTGSASCAPPGRGPGAAPKCPPDASRRSGRGDRAARCWPL